MNITHFVENFERGGLERVVIDLIQAQRDAGDTCRAICLFQRGALADELAELGIDVHTCGKRRGADVGALLRARALLRQPPGTILHTHNAAAHYHAVLAATGQRFARVVNTRHGMGAADPASRREWIYRRSMRRTDVVVAVCESARVQFEAQGVRPRAALLAVPNGIRVERFAPASREARDRLVAELGFAPGTRLVGTVGRLNWAKDQLGLIRAFRLVCDALPDIALVLIGEGALRATLEQTARDEGIAARVRFLGDRGDVDRLLSGLDVFVLSSVTEGYSIALLEACAAGLPIVATDVGGNAEIVTQNVNGRIVPARDVAALAAAMLAILTQPERAFAMGQAGRAWVLAEGSFRTMAARYARIYAGETTSPGV